MPHFGDVGDINRCVWVDMVVYVLLEAINSLG